MVIPEEIEKVNLNRALKIKDKTEVIIGASESMSKSKKNTIDPETMIKQYGADAVDGLSYLIVHRKRIFNGQTRVLLLQTNFYKEFGI